MYYSVHYTFGNGLNYKNACVLLYYVLYDCGFLKSINCYYIYICICI